MRLVVLLTSPRVAPGLLSWSAWTTLAAAGRRIASSADLPLVRAVGAAGHPVDVLPAVSVADLLAAAREDDVVFLTDDVEADRVPAELASYLMEAGEQALEVEVLHGSYDVPARGCSTW